MKTDRLQHGPRCNLNRPWEVDDTQADLMPCPFCGGTPFFGEVPKGDDFGGQYIECEECHAATCLVFACMDDPKPKLIELWNRRQLAIEPI